MSELKTVRAYVLHPPTSASGSPVTVLGDYVPADAARDLYAACEAATRELAFCVEVAGRRGGMYEKALAQCRAALAAARGESNDAI